MGDFQLNSIPGHMHVVSAGETLKDIAKKNGVSVSDLMKANPDHIAKAGNGNYYVKDGAVLAIPQKTAEGTQNRAKIFAKAAEPGYCSLQEAQKAREEKVAQEPVLEPWTPVVVNDPDSPISHALIVRVRFFENGKYGVQLDTSGLVARDALRGGRILMVPKSWVKVDETQVALDIYDRERSFPGKVYDFLKPW